MKRTFKRLSRKLLFWLSLVQLGINLMPPYRMTDWIILAWVAIALSWELRCDRLRETAGMGRDPDEVRHEGGATIRVWYSK